MGRVVIFILVRRLFRRYVGIYCELKTLRRFLGSDEEIVKFINQTSNLMVEVERVITQSGLERSIKYEEDIND